MKTAGARRRGQISRRRRAAAPKLERLDPRQRKGFVIVALAGGQAAGIDAIWCRHTISHCRNRMGLCSKILHPSHKKYKYMGQETGWLRPQVVPAFQKYACTYGSYY